MALQDFEYLSPADAINHGLTPTAENYIDLYDFSTYDRPDVRAEAIRKYDNTVGGFLKKMASVEQLKSDKYIWTELERRAVTYDDAVLTVGTDNVLTRDASAPVAFRLHEKVKLYTSAGAGTFIVTAVNSSTSVNLGTYDQGSLDLVAGYTAPITGIYTYSLGIEVGKGSAGADFTAGLKLPYSVHSVRPAITRNVYTELGSTPPVAGWVSINGEFRWFLHEIDATREDTLEMIEKKGMEGEAPAVGSDAETLGLQGTQGAFDQVESRGATWLGQITTTQDLEDLLKHYNKVQGAYVNLFMSSIDQSLAFDSLGRQFNASYGGTSVLDNHVGEYMMSQGGGKILNLGTQGFIHGGYTFLHQNWKYLTENSFRGNDAIPEADKMHFLAVPLGMTPVMDGDQSLAANPRTVQRNYMTKMELRPFNSWAEGGATWLANKTNGDDSFKIYFLEESALALFNAEKFAIGKGTAV